MRLLTQFYLKDGGSPLRISVDIPKCQKTSDGDNCGRCNTWKGSCRISDESCDWSHASSLQDFRYKHNFRAFLGGSIDEACHCTISIHFPSTSFQLPSFTRHSYLPPRLKLRYTPTKAGHNEREKQEFIISSRARETSRVRNPCLFMMSSGDERPRRAPLDTSTGDSEKSNATSSCSMHEHKSTTWGGLGFESKLPCFSRELEFLKATWCRPQS